MIIAGNLQFKSHIMQCPTYYLWFSRWSMGCETWMGYILKQNKVISNMLFLLMISRFGREIKYFVRQEAIWKTKKFCMGLVYTVVFFVLR